MSKIVNVGVVGCGNVMMHAYAHLMQTLEYQKRIKVTVACDVIRDKRAEVAQLFPDARFTTRYEDVINAADVDLIIVLTSMPEHGPISKAALEAGKHVLVEKPMAVTLEEAKRLVELSKSSKGYLLCAPHVILSETFQTIWHHLNSGAIGSVHLARARYGWAGPWWGKWFYRSGGGPLFDLGVYSISSLTGLLGPAQRVTAMTGTAIPERVVDGELIKVDTADNFQLLIEFENTLFATVTTGFSMQKYRSPAVELYGTEGTLQMMGDDWSPEGYELWKNSVGAWQVFGETSPSWPWTDGLRHLIDCINTGERPLITPEHAYHVLEIMMKALEAGKDGQTKTLTSRFEPLQFVTQETTQAHLVHDRSHS